MDSRFSHLARGAQASWKTTRIPSVVYKPRSKEQGSADVKIQAMRSALPRTHPPHRLNGVRSPTAGCDHWWNIRCKIGPPSGKGKRGEKSLYMLRAPKNGKPQPSLLRSPNTRHRRPVHGLNHSKCSTKPLIYIRNIQKAKREKKSWYQYIFLLLRGNCCNKGLPARSPQDGQASRNIGSATEARLRSLSAYQSDADTERFKRPDPAAPEKP
jgi:hypothetical protein